MGGRRFRTGVGVRAYRLGSRALGFGGGSLVALLCALVLLSTIAATYRSTATIMGTMKPDVLRGTKGGDVMRGLAGADRVYGLLGNDRLYGGKGADLLVGSDGRDTLTGDAGDDRLHGGPGDDRLVGGPGRDVLAGGAGNNVVDARDGASDVIVCVAAGRDTILQDVADQRSSSCPSLAPPPPRPGYTVIRTDESWSCRGPVDLDLVKVTMRTVVDDAIRLDENCSGRIGRVEVETWTADGIKVQNHGVVAHDLVIESGYIKCHDVAGTYHQDGIQAMGGTRLTFRGLRVDCLRNANLFVNYGGKKVSVPTDVICDRCILGPNSAQTLFVGTSIRSGARNTTICTGRYRALRVGSMAEVLVNENNTVLPRDHPSCADVTGRSQRS